MEHIGEITTLLGAGWSGSIHCKLDTAIITRHTVGHIARLPTSNFFLRLFPEVTLKWTEECMFVFRLQEEIDR